jgi:hypothetical protein
MDGGECVGRGRGDMERGDLLPSTIPLFKTNPNPIPSSSFKLSGSGVFDCDGIADNNGASIDDPILDPVFVSSFRSVLRVAHRLTISSVSVSSSGPGGVLVVEDLGD